MEPRYHTANNDNTWFIFKYNIVHKTKLIRIIISRTESSDLYRIQYLSNLPSSTLSLGCLGCLADRTGEPRLKLSFLRTCSALISASALSRTSAASRDDSMNGDVARGPRVVAVVPACTGTSSFDMEDELDRAAASAADLAFPSTEVVAVNGGRRWLVGRCMRLRCSRSRSEAVGGRFNSLLLMFTVTEEEPDEDEADRSRTVAVFVGVSGDLVGEVLSAVSDPMAE